MLVYYNTNSFFLRSFNDAMAYPLHWSVHSVKLQSVSDDNFFILKFHCIMLLLNSVTSKYTFFRRII